MVVVPGDRSNGSASKSGEESIPDLLGIGLPAGCLHHGADESTDRRVLPPADVLGGLRLGGDGLTKNIRQNEAAVALSKTRPLEQRHRRLRRMAPAVIGMRGVCNIRWCRVLTELN